MEEDLRRMLGYVPNLHDARDFAFGVEPDLRAPEDVPEVFSLLPRSLVLHIVQSAQSCVGFAIAGMIHALWTAEHVPLEMPSPLFIWRVSRQRHEAQSLNTGTYLRTAFQALRKVGYCPESKWPSLYGEDARLFDKKPNHLAMRAAIDQRMGSLHYSHVLESGAARVDAVKRALSSRKGITLGMMVDEAFLRWRGEGMIQPHDPKKDIGGHAMRFTEYDREGLYGPNSWPREWGRDGWTALSWDTVASSNVLDVCAVKAPPKWGRV